MAGVIKTQTDLIGNHPQNPNIFGVWLSHTDHPVSENKKHRILIEDISRRNDLVDQLSDWIIHHHISERKIEFLNRKTEILSKYNYDKYIDDQKLLPSSDTTKKGNATEILLCEYLKSTTQLSLLVFRLRYNQNVDQAIKGDDVLLFDLSKRKKRMIVGESKFRGIPKRKDVIDIVTNLEGKNIYPMSIPFIAQCLEETNPELFEILTELNGELHKNLHDIRHAGFLFSDTTTSRTVERHLDTTNPNLVFISLGVDNPGAIIENAFVLADKKLKALKK